MPLTPEEFEAIRAADGMTMDEIQKLSPESKEYYKELYVKYLEQGPEQEHVADIDYSNVSNEADPDISWKDRAAVKNLGVSTVDSIKYLEEKYPDKTFVANPDGEIYIQSGEKLRPLDPPGFDPADITDVGADVAAGAAEAGAGTAALAGSLAGGPVGWLSALPGMMAASGAAGVGMEGLRQALSKAVGVSRGFDPKQMLTSGLVSGAAAPLSFAAKPASMLIKGKFASSGARKFAEELAKQAGEQAENVAVMSDKELAKIAAENLQGVLQKAGGLAGSGLKNVGAFMSGTEPEVFGAAVKRIGRDPEKFGANIKRILSGKPREVRTPINPLQESEMTSSAQKLGGKFFDVFKKSIGEKQAGMEVLEKGAEKIHVNATEALDTVNRYIAQYELNAKRKGANPKLWKPVLKELYEVRQTLYGHKKSGFVPFMDARIIQSRVKAETPEMLFRSAKDITPDPKAGSLLKQVYSKIEPILNKELDRAVPEKELADQAYAQILDESAIGRAGTLTKKSSRAAIDPKKVSKVISEEGPAEQQFRAALRSSLYGLEGASEEQKKSMSRGMAKEAMDLRIAEAMSGKSALSPFSTNSAPLRTLVNKATSLVALDPARAFRAGTSAAGTASKWAKKVAPFVPSMQTSLQSGLEMQSPSGYSMTASDEEAKKLRDMLDQYMQGLGE